MTAILTELADEISEALLVFIQSHTGRAIGVQLALPLRGF